MARIVNATLTNPTRELTDEQRRTAQRKIERLAARNRLRRVRLACHIGFVRDPQAALGDSIWCDDCGDFGRVVHVEQ